MAVAYSDLGAILWVKNTEAPAKYEYFIPIRTVPATGSAPAQIEVTELDSTYKQNILDRQDTPMFEFMYNYTVENFERVSEFADGSTSHEYLITYQDKSGFQFEGAGTTWTNELAAGSAIEAQVSFAVTSKKWVEDATALVDSTSVPTGKKNVFSV